MRTHRLTPTGWAVDSSITPTRNIEYYKLSDWFNIEFYFSTAKAAARIVPKNLSATQLDDAFDHPQCDDPIIGDLDDELLND